MQDLANTLEDRAGASIKGFVADGQDPELVKRIHERIKDVLTKEETIKYIGVQQRPIANFAPDAVVLTNRRFITFHPKMLGRADFQDFIWRDLADVKLEENILSATITFIHVRGTRTAMDWLPKVQARKIYAFAQEMEERVREERRVRDMEEKRAAAGGVFIQSPLPSSPSGSAAAEDPMQRLKRLKEMLDAGLITAGEYEAKRAAILAQI